MSRLLPVALPLLGGMCLVCCGQPAPGVEEVLAPDPQLGFARKVFVVTTDYQTGAYAVLDLDLGLAAPDLDTIHPDAVARLAGEDLVVVNRLRADNIQKISVSQGFETTWQRSVGNGSNPQGAVLLDGRLWVSRLNSASLIALDPDTGAEVGSADLSAFAEADGLPEVNDLAAMGGVLVASLQHLDRDAGWVPSQAGELVLIEPTTGEVLDPDPSTAEREGIFTRFANPVGGLIALGDQQVAVLTQGSYTTVGDGGIERVSVGPIPTSEILVTETELGGSCTAWASPDGERFFVIVNEPLTPGSFDVATVLKLWHDGGLTEVLRTPGYDLADVAVTAGGELLVADRRAGASGVWVYDLETLTPHFDVPIPVGLAPFELVPLDPMGGP